MHRQLTSDLNNVRVAAQDLLDGEAELVSRARQHLPDAWTTIYRIHQPAIYRYVFARTGEHELAEDLTATVFVQAIRRIETYRHAGRPFLAWLYAIARNAVNYHHRTRLRKGSDLPLPAEGSRQPAAGGWAEAAALTQGLDVRRAVAMLTGDQREVIVLRYVVGLSTPEVATLLGKHEAAVYSLQARAIRALRKHLA